MSTYYARELHFRMLNYRRNAVMPKLANRNEEVFNGLFYS
jgi:hypothetical protein